MNDIWEIHQERLQDKKQIQQGLQIKSLKQSQIEYYERERQRQKRQNTLIMRFKNVNKSFNLSQLKKQRYLIIQVRTFLNTVVNIMNSYLHDDGKVIINMSEVKIKCNRNTDQGSKNCKLQQDSYKSISPQVYPVDSSIEKSLTNEDNLSNFYQTYINLFVNFFNLKAQQNPTLIKLDNIRSIIRPNNQFVIIDLLKSLIQYSRYEFRLLLKQFLNDETIRQNYLMKKNMYMVKMELDHIEETQESETMTDLSVENDNMRRKVQTQPQVYGGDFSVQLRRQMIKLTPATKHSVVTTTNNSNNNKCSIISLLKRNSTQVLRSKTQDSNNNQTIIKKCLIQGRFIDMRIKQMVYERNYQFIKQVNMQKLENKANSLYIQLLRLNGGNKQMIDRFNESCLGRRRGDKFNYDQSGLYTQGEVVAKRETLQKQMIEFENKPVPNSRSSPAQLKAHVVELIKHRQRCQQLHYLTKSSTNKLSHAISKWLPLRLQHSQVTIGELLRLHIEQVDQSTGEVISYHWRQYRKPFSISDFLKQNIKTTYDRTLCNKINTTTTSDKRLLQVDIFKKKKFKKSMFVDNRKRINQLIQKNNYVSIKKDVLFPVIKGTQQSCIRNSSNINMIINQNTSYQLQNNIYKNKDILRADFIQKKMQNLSTKQSFNINSSKSKQISKEYDSMKKIILRQHSERKHSQSQKLIERLNQQEIQRSEILSKLSIKHQTPLSLTNRDSSEKSQKSQRKSMISIPKYLDIKPEQTKDERISKLIQVSMITGKKLPALKVLSS